MSCCVTFRAAVSRIWARTSAKHLTQLPHSRRLQQTSPQLSTSNFKTVLARLNRRQWREQDPARKPGPQKTIDQ